MDSEDEASGEASAAEQAVPEEVKASNRLGPIGFVSSQ